MMSRTTSNSITLAFFIAAGVSSAGSAHLGLVLSSGTDTWLEMFYSPAIRRLMEVALLYPLVASGLAVHLLASAIHSRSRSLLAGAIITALMGVFGGIWVSQVAGELAGGTYDAGFRVKTADAISYPVLFLVTRYYAGLWLPALAFAMSTWCLWSKVLASVQLLPPVAPEQPPRG